MTDQEYVALRDEIQRLRDEQQRLRDEQERIRQERDAAAKNGHKDPADQKSEMTAKESEQRDKPGQDKDQEKKGGENKEDQNEQPKPPMLQRVRAYVAKHRTGVLLGAVGAVVLIVGCVFLFMYLSSYESTDDAEVEGHLDPISARIGGTVAAVYVENDQPVQAGQLLVDLDPRDDQVALERAEAVYAQAEAQLRAENPNVPIINTENETSIATSESQLSAAQAAVAAAEQEYQAKEASLKEAVANNAKAQTDVERFQYLVEKEEVSREQFDTARATAQTGAAAVQAAEASAKAAQKAIEQARAQLQEAESRQREVNQNAPRSVAIRQEDLATRQANVKGAAAGVDQAKLNVSYLKIFAPTAGVIGERSAEIGERIQPGQQLMMLSEIADVWITANFKETQLKRMRPGQAVTVSVDAYGTIYHGYVQNMPGATGAVTSLLPPENATGNYVKVVQRLPVRIHLNPNEDPQHLLRPGMSVEPKVWLNTGPPNSGPR